MSRWTPRRHKKPQAVARTAHRLNGLDAKRAIDLLAQVAHVDVDHVRAVLVLRVSGALEQPVTRQQLTRVAHEHLQQLQLLRNSEISAPPRHTRCVAGSRSRSPTPSTGARSAGLRRTSARRRATSSPKSNGFVT
jgi:hypothetical protein